MEKEFEVWMEGYAASGEHSDASFLGKVVAENFDEACIKLQGKHLDKNSDGTYSRGAYRGKLPPPSKGVSEKMQGNYSVWACQLFDNETDARKSFG